MENEVQSEEEATEEAIADGTFQESREVWFEIGMLGLLEPVLESGTRDAGLLGELALGGGRAVGVGKVASGLSGFGATPTEGIWPGVGGGIKLRVSHGPSLSVCLWQRHTREMGHAR